MKRSLMVLAVLSTLACAGAAWAQSKGSSIFALEFTDGTADLADLAGAVDTGYIGAYSVPEIGIQAQYWHLMDDDYALALSAGVGMARETDQPGNGAGSGAPDLDSKASSFNGRIGGDRVVRVGVRAIMYGGPGIEYWRGKAKYENFGGPGTVYEGQTTTRFSLSARIGAIMTLNDQVGLIAHVGHRFGRASAEEDAAKTKWWPSSFEGSMGVSWMFGTKS